MGKFDPVHLTHRDDGKDTQRCTGLAAGFIDDIIDCRIFIYHLAERENLPHRHTAVWKENYLERNVEVDSEVLISFLSYEEEDEKDRCCLHLL